LTGTVNGLIWGGGSDQLIAQVKGSAVITVCALGVGLALMYLVKLTGTLRVSEEGELEGLDIHEHGAPAYTWSSAWAPATSPPRSERSAGRRLRSQGHRRHLTPAAPPGRILSVHPSSAPALPQGGGVSRDRGIVRRDRSVERERDRGEERGLGHGAGHGVEVVNHDESQIGSGEVRGWCPGMEETTKVGRPTQAKLRPHFSIRNQLTGWRSRWSDPIMVTALTKVNQARIENDSTMANR